jgi:hypothetical protein
MSEVQYIPEVRCISEVQCDSEVRFIESSRFKTRFKNSGLTEPLDSPNL